MTKIKVKINAPIPPLETVHRYRDFDGLMAKFQKYYSTRGIREMLYNDRRKLVYIVIIVILLLLLLFVEDITKKQGNSKQEDQIEEMDRSAIDLELTDLLG
ncbi:hypothetical protein FNH22_02350 [Fulvivirga sp. M361]|uniref:hypothetical protein n=1 Tax=Fulvivirga sp. M361 TaxID=2594266 RepID=UPI001179B606|nr:hypothetical protein [Fulvivirga sp. M361]TRX62180.1 hypothetical protein FNH22_02350 [Fulvivirga sp. M361]